VDYPLAGPACRHSEAQLGGPYELTGADSYGEIKSEDGRRRLHALVQGRVQGVFFRDYCREHALRLGLVGWVRNLPDGRTLEVTVEGPRRALQELVAFLREGPPGAYVQAVEVEWDLPQSEFGWFRVR